MKQRKKWLWCLIVFLLAMTLLTGCSLWGTGKSKEELEQAKQLVIEHLENKYRHDFVATEIKYIPNTSDYEVRIQVQDAPSIRFYAHYNEQLQTITDQYLVFYWEKETNEELRQLLSKLYLNLEGVRSYLAALGFEDINDRNKMVKDLKEKGTPLPNYKELKEKHLDLEISIDIKIESQITKESKKKHIQNVYQLIEYYKGQGIIFRMLWVGFYEKGGENPTDVIGMNTPELEQASSPADVEKEWFNVEERRREKSLQRRGESRWQQN